MSVDYRVISIGTLSAHRLWSESRPVRTGHATIVLVEEGDRRILVDPSLPEQILAARFSERTGKGLDWVTDVFCTTLRPIHRRGIEALSHADWFCSQAELEAYRHHLESLSDSASRLDAEQLDAIEADQQLLESFRPAEDKLSAQVSLFPLPGASVGSAGLLLTPPTKTILVVGDAVLTGEHMRAGQIWQGAIDADAAGASFREALEIADVIIPGHDNVQFSPQRWF
ncbi:MAG: MBL fold metallo-hydrolase [Phycisphaerae bacterium]